MNNKIKYIVIAGSSGGHILPAIKLINELSKIKNPKNILFISDKIGKKFIEKTNYSKIKTLEINSSYKFNFILKIIKNVLPILLNNRKLKLIGFGGFMTVPVLFFSKILNIFFLSSNKIYIHEQNYIFGLANKFNYFLAHKVFTSFPSNKILKNKEIYVGNYFNDKVLPNSYDKNENLIKILLIGGSAGSLELNDLLIDKLKNTDKDLNDKIKLFVQIPSLYLKDYESKYLKLLKNISFFTFKNDINYNDYDLILSRSGSGSLNDILYNTNSVFFLPHMHSRDGHQKLNLNYFKKYNQSLDDFKIPLNKKIPDNYFFNNLINPFSINKIVCYITK